MALARVGIVAALLLTSSTLRAQEDPAGPLYVAAPIDAPAKEAVAGINRFTLDLFKQMAGGDRSIFLSPASVSTAMALAYRGAKGETAEEMRRVLHFPAAPQAYLAAQAPLMRAMSFSAPGRTLSTNNSLWVQDDLRLNPAYLADVSANADAGLQRVDFRGAPQPSRLKINAWVSDRTRNRINDLVPQDAVTTSTRAILVNTIYWKAHWGSEFPSGATAIEPFTRLDGRTVRQPLMHASVAYRVLERGGIKAIDLPYRNGEVSMTVLMPNSARGLPRFEADLSDERLTALLAALDATDGRPTILTFPKMHLTWDGDLSGPLQLMGLRVPFDDQADFTAMATAENGTPLKIGAIIHKTWLDVDEKGSEAAAATAVVDVIVSGLRRREPEPPPFVFRADKPFLFLLRDRRTGMILFIGRYTGEETQ